MTSRAATTTFCEAGKSGLGHLRRWTTIATAIRRLAPDCTIRLVTIASTNGVVEEDLGA